MHTVMIAGGASGIGLAVARSFRRDGHAVLLADMNKKGAYAAVEEELPGPGAAFVCDLEVADAAEAAVNATVEAFGSLDVLFANAGVLVAASLSDWSVDDWDRTMNVNLRAPFLLAKSARKWLEQSSIGSLIFTSSTAAYRGNQGIHAYAASKAGLIGMVRSLAAELSPRGVRVNCICPGLIDTPFNDPFWDAQEDRAATLRSLLARVPAGRQGIPDDVVGVVRFLASQDASYVTGQAFVVDGGYLAV